MTRLLHGRLEEIRRLGFVRRLLADRIPVYWVGGGVRDALLGRESHDLDLCVLAPTGDVENRLRPLGRVHRVGASFPVLKFKPEGWSGEDIDISGPVKRGRIETDPQAGSLTEDLTSRDLTVNAMAVDLATGELVDPLNAVEDLRAGRFRAAHEAAFRDDPLRILRTARLAGTIGFSVEASTLRSMNEAALGIAGLARERLTLELHRLLVEPVQPSVSLLVLRDAGALPFCMEPLERTIGLEQPAPYHDADVFHHTLRAVDAVRAEPLLRFAALVHDWGKPLVMAPHPKDGRISFFGHEKESERLFRQWYDEMGLSMCRLDKDAVALLVRQHMRRVEDLQTPAAIRRFLGRLGSPEMFETWLELAVADTLASGQPWRARELLGLGRTIRASLNDSSVFSLRDLAINGKDLLLWSGHREPGPWVGDRLRQALDAVQEGSVENERNALRQWFVRLGNEGNRDK